MEEVEGKIQQTYSFLTSVLGSDVKISNGCFVSGKRLLLSYYNSPCIYVCGYDGSVVHMITLEHNPWDVAMIDNERAIVTLNYKGFQILDLTTLTLGRCIQLEESVYYAVTCSNNQMWTSSGGFTINQIDTSDNILRSIETKNKIKDFCIDKDSNTYYTTISNNNVYRKTPDEQESIFYRHSNLRRPWNVVVDEDCNVYVSGLDSNNIHRISSDGNFHRIILTEKVGIKAPWGLCYNWETKQLLVTNDNRNSVAIFNLS